MKCAYLNANQKRCKANAMKKSKYCFAHNPKTRDEHALAVKKGGKLSRKTKLDMPPVEIKSPADVVNLLEETINGIRDGSIPPNVANTIAYVCSHAIKAIELSKYADKIESVERILMERKITK